MRRGIEILLCACLPSWAANSYYTTFPSPPAPENPSSEGSLWTGGQSAGGNLWGDTQTVSGKVYGVSEPTAFGDPTALLSGKGAWGANQTAQGTVSTTNPTG